MSVNLLLTHVASGLFLSEAEKSSISRAIGTLSSRLSAYFGDDVTEHFQFGSSTRETILPHTVDSRADVDYMVVFGTAHGEKKPQTYLDRLRRFAEATYSASKIDQSSPKIVLRLNGIKIELVPAISQRGYQIPSPALFWSDWMSTYPLGMREELENKNKSNSFQIKPLVRLIKYWNAANGHVYASFALEEYIVRRPFWSCSSLRDYFYDFWDGAGYPPGASPQAIDRVEQAKRRVKKASEYEARNMSVDAEEEIRKLLQYP